MKRSLLTLAAAGVLLAASASDGLAFGHGGRHGMGGPPMMGGGPDIPLPVLVSVMTPDQRNQLRDLTRSERPDMKAIFEQLRSAHEALSDRLVAPGPLTAADLDPQVKKIAGLRDQLVQQALATTLKVRALLTPDQLAEAAKKMQRLRELHTEMRTLLGPPGQDGVDD